MNRLSEISDNSNKIQKYIEDNPGVHLRKIQRDLDIPLGTVRHHLSALEKNGKITSEKNIIFRCYFSSGFSQNDRDTLKILQHETAREILLYIMEKKSVNQNEVAGNIGISASSVNWHMKRLSSVGIVTISKSGKHVIYELNINPVVVVKLLKNYHPKIWDRWSDRVAEMFLTLPETNE